MEALKPVVDDFWRWTWFSEDKGMNFNGYAARLPEGLVLIDPALADETVWSEIEALGKPVMILLTNKDHERASDELRKRFGVPVAVHEEEAPLLKVPPERTFGDDETVAGCLRVFRFRGLKSPAEVAFHWPDRKVLIVGDSIIGHPKGKLGLVKKHVDQPAVLDGLKKLGTLDFETLLVGDGEPFITGGKPALSAFLEN